MVMRHGWTVGMVSMVGGALLLGAVDALADGTTVQIQNDGTEDVIVTVYDLTTRPRGVLLANARINGFTSVPISAATDATGHATLAWTAVSVDATARKCGHAESVQTTGSEAVKVHADAECQA